MALLNKLMYYGIRSVPGDSKDKIYLEFESPLTIIWGPNGSGKTTLIEALKFVTANEAPPGDKQAFVHNLKLARSQRVDSLIMLEFTSEKKKRVTVTKRFNAAATTKNKAGLQFKSDESTINIHDEQGKVRSVSSKNADFQAEVLSHLGVPAAILSNVIFCHQEDSCWPLSESRELKIRFDKIFQLQKFTKAIDQAKKIRKDQATKMKLFKSEADHHALLMTNKGRFLKTKSDTKEEYLNNQKALEKLAESIAEKTVELEKMEAEIKKSEVQRRQRDILMTQLAIFRKTITNIEAQDIEPFSGSMEELEEQKKQVLQQMENEKQHDSARILREIKWNLEQKKQERERCQQELNEAIRRKDNYEQTMIEVAEMQQTIIQRFPFVAEEGGAANLVEEIPRLVAQRRRLLEEAKRLNMLTRRNLQQQYEETSSALTRAQADISFIGQNRSKVSKEVAEVERKLAMAEKLLKGENVLIVLRPDEIKAEQVRVAQELKRTRKELAPLDTKADLYETWIAETSEKSCCPLCERKFIDQGGAECLVQKLNDMTLLLPDDTSRLTQRVTKLELEEGILIAALKDAERLVSLQPSLQDLDEKLAQKRRQLPELEQMVQSRKKRISDGEQDIVDKEQGGEGELKELDMAHRNLVVLKKKAEQIFTPEQQMEQLRNQLKRLEAEYNDCLVQQSNADNSNSRYTKIMERKRYIDRQLELLEITKRIDSIQVDLGALNVPGDQDSQYMHMEFQKKTSSLNQDVMIKAKIEGQMVEIKRKNKEVKKELETDAMKNAEMTFRNTLINKAVCEKIMEDLDSFVAVLDQSILKFHKDKMTAINVILDDLWRKVYNGVDIETIRIKTEKNEGADKRASYDYMVMMVLEGGVEVGMKDRCSAGQKMLASLLIRIALADVFAKTCSIIALDEPTTNLDTVKIEQMSAMLNTLIATRRADDRQGNVQGKQFQMVVITHDERLVNALKLGCRPGRTFRISKDPLSGKSRLDAYDYAGNKIDA